MLKITVRHPRNKNYLYLGVGFLVGLTLLVIFLPPENLVNLILFYVLLFLGTFYLFRYIFNQSRQALLISSGLILFLILRQLGLKHWIYPILITALILSLETTQQSKS